MSAYVLAGSPEDRAAVAKDMQISDRAVQDSVAAYLAAHGGISDDRGRLMGAFAAKFQAWKHVRDTVVRPAADSGRPSAALAAIHGPLATADEAMGAPLDTLFTDEQTAADATARQAAAEYSSVRLKLVLVVLIGVLAATAGAWWLTRRVLAAIAVVREALFRLTRGDLGWRAPAQRGGDELTQMVGAAGDAAEGMRTVVVRVVPITDPLVTKVIRLLGPAVDAEVGYAASGGRGSQPIGGAEGGFPEDNAPIFLLGACSLVDATWAVVGLDPVRDVLDRLGPRLDAALAELNCTPKPSGKTLAETLLVAAAAHFRFDEDPADAETMRQLGGTSEGNPLDCLISEKAIEPTDALTIGLVVLATLADLCRTADASVLVHR